MATYRFREGHAYPAQSGGGVAYRRNINIPDLIANQGLTDTDGAAQTLASTGFAASDVLQIFLVPAGFLLAQVGVRVTTAEGGACTADIGNASATQTHRLAADAVGYMGTCDLNSETAQITLIADTHIGGSTYMGAVFITNGSIDFTFVTAATAVAVFDVWAVGWQVF